MSIIYSQGTDTYLRDVNRVPLNGSFPAISLSGHPGNGMAVYEVFPTQAVSAGNTVVPETVDLTADFVAFDPPGGPQGLLVAPR